MVLTDKYNKATDEIPTTIANGIDLNDITTTSHALHCLKIVLLFRIINVFHSEI